MPKPWEKYGNTGVVAPADPYKVEDQQMQREAARRAAAAAERANANAAEQIRLARERFEFEKQKAQNGLTPKDRADALEAFKAAERMDRAILDLEKKYASGPGATTGLAGIEDFFPTEANKRFDNAGQALRGDVGRLLGFTGGQLNTATEAAQAVGPYLPDTNNYDTNILDKIARLKDLSRTARERSIAIFGGIPDQFGNVSRDMAGNPVPQTPQLSPQARGTAMGTTQSEIAKGGTEAIPVPEAMRAGLEGYLRGRRGTQVDKQDFAAFYNDLAKRNNYPGGTPESLDRYIRQFNESGVIGPITPAQKDIGALQQGYNWAAQTPVGTALLHGANASAGGLPELLGGQAVTEGLRELSSLNKPSAILGDVIGGVGGTLGLGKGLNIAGVASPKALTLANLANSTMFGAASSPENRLAGGGVGFLAGAAGDLGGQYAVAPLAEAIGRKPVNAALAAMGRTPFPVAPRLSPAERMITTTVGGEGRAVTNMLGDASSLGLPMTLADTTEGLRSLGGAVARRSPVARNTARNVMEPRALGQIDRLQGALNRDIGPTANIPQRSEDLIAQARANAAPLYAQAYENPGASSVDLSGILKTDMGQRGLQNAGRRVSNRLDASGQPIDPRSMGFDFNDAGETVIGKTPSFQTLDQFKKGLDDIIEGGWDPVKASYSPDAQAAIGLKNHLVSQMDQVNPDYAAARAAYAGPASQREALNLGQKGISQPSDQIGVQLNGLPPSQQEQYRLGALSALSQKANSARFGTNPYETIYGSPEAQRRVQTLFPEANLGRFGRQYQLEGQMAQSRNQILGGSPTALNQRADQAFDVPVGATLAIDGASAMLAGAPPVATGARLLGGISKDAIKLGIGKKKAEALAPLLFSPDASTSAAAFVELTKNARRADVFKKATKRRRGLFGGLFGGATGAAATSGQQ